MNRILRVYCDTSVFGGCFDEEFSEDSIRLFDHFRSGTMRLLLSTITLDELTGAPPRILDLLETLPPESWELVESSPEYETCVMRTSKRALWGLLRDSTGSISPPRP